jgi:hypothetical protein
MTSLVARTIDLMLPALSDIGAELGVQRPNDNQAGTLCAPVTPLALGFAAFGLGALALMRWAEGRRASSRQGTQPAA